ncbi:MAG: hypothetical protein ILO34_02940 [Kiritimatiellae bacterium]|nr:hypothetical protein [Kiritimatiellia bacterium]
MEKEESIKLDPGLFDFTPDWAKKDAGVSVPRVRPERESGAGQAPGGHFASKKPFAKKFDRRGGDGERHQRFQDRPKPLDAEIRILPDSKALGTIMRKIQQDFHAYKLKDIAYFFLDNPSSILLKITPRGEEKFVQCKVCGFAALDESAVVEHAVQAHLGDYYDSKVVDCEPPKGNFNCVARCGLSGVLLGPPNIHEFNAVVRETMRTKFPSMGEAEYRSHIEMVRDAETIEEWRKGAVKKTVFFAKGGGEGAAELSREQADGELRRIIVPTLIDRPRHLMITADKAAASPVRPLQWLARDAIEAERRAPYNMCFALRGAFHHRKFNFFRANDQRGPEFVSAVEYREFDAAHAIAELAEVAKFVAENPCSPRVDIAGDDAERAKQLDWLVSTGHVVAFTNGVYSPVEKFPKYGPQWQKRRTKNAKREEEAPQAEGAAEAEAPSGSPAETPAAEEKKDETAAQLA